MKISIITVTFNSASTLRDAIESVINQTYTNIEYIIIDGKSIDGTIDIVKSYGSKVSKFISEPDKGLYDAMNKGIKLATGEIIGILNSDDLYFDEYVIENVAKIFEAYPIDCLWGDLVYFKDNPNKFIRIWKSGEYKPGIFKTGWMPPHPTFFVKKEIYEKYGYFKLEFSIAADYELMLRFLEKYRIKGYYLPKFLVKMRAGGKANKPKNIIIANLECIKAWKMNGLEMPFYTPFFKLARKIPQILKL
jgi:glycosyltransferase involved in cell wall biosynthesis